MKGVENWVAWAVVSGGVFLACVVAAVCGLQETVLADEDAGAAVTDATTYKRVDALRKRLYLTDENLAVLGCSQESAENVLRTLVNWYEQNRTDLEDILRKKASKDLREAIRKAGTGTEGASLQEVGTLKAAYAESLATEKRLLDAAVGQIEARLSDGQKQTWRLARVSSRALRECRFVPNLTAVQKRALCQAFSDYETACSEAETEAEAQAARVTRDAAVRATLSADQLGCLEQAKTNLRQCMEGVLAASAEVMPLPAELKPEAAISPEGQPTQ